MALVAGSYVALGLVLGWQGDDLGARWIGSTVSPLSSSSAVAMLSAVASGMLAFTGIVFSLALVALQFPTTAYSPRVVNEMGPSTMLPHVVGVFCGTFVYSLLAIRTIDVEGGPGINTPVAVTALAWLLASVLLLLLLLPRLLTFTIGRVLTELGLKGRTAAIRLYGAPTAGQRTSRRRTGGSPEGRPINRVLHHDGPPQHIVGFDLRRLVDQARRADALIELPRAIGEIVCPGDQLAVVRGARRPVSEARIRKAVWLAAERSTANDPAYALRLLVDVALRALSPAVNDPATAVDVLDQVDALLRLLGRSELRVGRQHDARGVLRVVFAEPSWEDLVTIGLAEINYYGRDSTIVQRRIEALVTGLFAALPRDRHAVLLRVVDGDEG